MKVFLSWSGKTSREVAQAFHDWLPYVIQAVKPFISTGDLDKGRRWSDVLATELNETAYGILFITLDNFDKPWLHFEAGAISKAVDKAYVSPFLFNIDASRIEGPLSQFEATINDPQDILRLLSSINNRLPEEQRLSFDVLAREFELLWPDLKKKLDKAAETQDLETHTGFPWLYNADDVAHRQEDATTKAVWIVTPDVYRNVLNDGLRKALQYNLDRDLPHTFIMPASEPGSAAREALRRTSGWELMTPKEFGPITRMPLVRAVRSSSRWRTSPSGPASANPAETTSRPLTPAPAQSRTTSRTDSAGTAMTARSTGASMSPTRA